MALATVNIDKIIIVTSASSYVYCAGHERQRHRRQKRKRRVLLYVDYHITLQFFFRKNVNVIIVF